jgi:hypothetical protein
VLGLLWQWATAWTADRRQQTAHDRNDRGEITSTLVFIGIIVGVAVVAAGIIAAKILDEANKVNTQ